MNNSKSFQFIPRKLNFWMLHTAGALCVFLINGYLSSVDQRNNLAEWVAQLTWFPAFTLAVLIYRAIYKNSLWKNSHYLNASFLTLVYSVVGSFLISCILLGAAYQFVSPQDINQTINSTEHSNHRDYALRLIFNNTVFNSLLLFSWIQIYNGILIRRQSHEDQLQRLQLEASLKEAQLANLSNQLNPHFLFNTLNNIKFMVRRDPQKTENMVTDLSDILRYSLESNRKEKVQICEELEVLNRYLDIVKVQMEDRLSLHLSIPQSLYTHLIPPMILQLLIENAIKHGIDCLRYGGRVTLIAEAISDQIHFLVENDIPQVNNNTKANIGIGLANIEQRLKLLYGNRASFDVDNSGSKFSVSLILPMEMSQ